MKTTLKAQNDSTFIYTQAENRLKINTPIICLQIRAKHIQCVIQNFLPKVETNKQRVPQQTGVT